MFVDQFNKTGVACKVCRGIDHRAQHHAKAAERAYLMQSGKGGGKGGRINMSGNYQQGQQQQQQQQQQPYPKAQQQQQPSQRQLQQPRQRLQLLLLHPPYLPNP